MVWVAARKMCADRCPASMAWRSLAGRHGADPKVVQRVLGHATAPITMDLYGHLVDGNLWQAARMVGGHHGGI
jgi:integrase